MINVQKLEAELKRRCAGPSCFGHLKYVDAPDDELVLLPNKQYMRIPAARAFLEMAIKAHVDEGINLLPAYCFRRHGFQHELFLNWAKKKNVGFEQNVKHVAPAGYSEHHTGYAVDIHDGPGPRQMPKTPFQDRPAYAWLEEHAGEFGFENSFPKNNVQGIIFEPWHWRWVGNEHAERVFEAARQLKRLDEENPKVGEAVRSAKETGIGKNALGSVKKTLRALFDAHDATMQEEQSKLDAFREGKAQAWTSASA